MSGVKGFGLGHEDSFETLRFFAATRNLCLKY